MTSMTFGELKLHSNRVREEPPVQKDFELAIREVIDDYRGYVSKTQALDALMRQRDLVDEEWRHDEVAAKGASGPDEGSSAEGEDAPETPPAA